MSLIPHLIIKTFKFYIINRHIFICIQYLYAYVLNHFSCVQLFATLWTEALQTPLSMRLSRQEYWNELPCPPSGDLLDSGIKPRSPALQADSLPSEPPGKPNLL